MRASFREQPEVVRTGLRDRGLDPEKELGALASLETRRRRIIPELENLKRQQNTSGDEIARAKRQGLDVRHVHDANKQRSQQIKQLDIELDTIERQRTEILLQLPNVPHASMPVGKSAADNVEVRRVGEPRRFDFEPRAHWEVGPALGVVDFERATKLSGARFSVLLGAGARLARALIDFMLDLHTSEHGYLEVEPPSLVSSAALTGTGNLPRFERISSRLQATGICISFRRQKCRSGKKGSRAGDPAGIAAGRATLLACRVLEALVTARQNGGRGMIH